MPDEDVPCTRKQVIEAGWLEQTASVLSQAFATCSRKGATLGFVVASRRKAARASIHSMASSGSV
ncbi:hypothetical protein ABT119_09680 [Streptomyces sp. NPDC001910]|uniref:hypothetical protein n=1 Tax=Streptomyces sp. NPDC001910 TaxID=3154403 RepID=UPI0033272C4F